MMRLDMKIVSDNERTTHAFQFDGEIGKRRNRYIFWAKGNYAILNGTKITGVDEQERSIEATAILFTTY